MDWARKIVVSGRALCAEVAAADGRVASVALAELGNRGVPGVRPAARKRAVVHFGDFAKTDAGEYLTYFGLGKCTEAAGCHQLFEVFVGDDRYLVPALVMMRALFRPTSKLLPQMFVPNALERTCRLGFADDVMHVIVDTPWAKGYDAEQRADCEGPLRWMMLHPSARRMANSVHQYAMAGLIAMDLPDAKSELVFAGFQSGNAVLFTEIRVLSVSPLDVPDLPVTDWAGRIDYVNRTWAEGRDLSASVSAEVPLHADGTHELTDEEWAIVHPILEGRRRRQPTYHHCPRSLLDGILGKLASGKSWRDSQYKAGDWRNAATTYRRWNTRGTFAEAIQALREVR
jgi:hypothetical protein